MQFQIFCKLSLSFIIIQPFRADGCRHNCRQECVSSKGSISLFLSRATMFTSGKVLIAEIRISTTHYPATVPFFCSYSELCFFPLFLKIRSYLVFFPFFSFTFEWLTRMLFHFRFGPIHACPFVHCRYLFFDCIFSFASIELEWEMECWNTSANIAATRVFNTFTFYLGRKICKSWLLNLNLRTTQADDEFKISIVQTTMSTRAPPQETEIEESDPVIAKIQKTGCLEKHYAVLVSRWADLLSLCQFILHWNFF